MLWTKIALVAAIGWRLLLCIGVMVGIAWAWITLEHHAVAPRGEAAVQAWREAGGWALWMGVAMAYFLKAMAHTSYTDLAVSGLVTVSFVIAQSAGWHSQYVGVVYGMACALVMWTSLALASTFAYVQRQGSP